MSDINQWGSHAPALMAAVANTNGAILECGCGDNSTALLHGLCLSGERELVTLESNLEWLRKYDGLACRWHYLSLVEDWDALNLGRRYGVVFVDHGHAPRGPVVALARTKADVVVMHDSECHYCGYTEPLKAFDWVWTHKNCPCWTTLAGMGEPPEWLAALTPGEFGIPTPYRG